MNDWKRVSREQPCRICHKPDWCTVAADGSAACCMRVESDKPMHNGGWMHPSVDGPSARPAYQPPMKRTAPVDLAGKWGRWLRETTPVDVVCYAGKLGVAVEALQALGAAWAWQHGAWAFPMRNGAGEIVGIRLRADTGRKWAVPGSHQGVFVPHTVPSVSHTALICEGPTDTAAALTLGFMAIGRPSCLGCEMALIETCKRLAVRRVVIVADNDGPGRTGAEKLAACLSMPTKTIIPPAKDLRSWLQAGATRAAVECLINQKIWRMP